MQDLTPDFGFRARQATTERASSFCNDWYLVTKHASARPDPRPVDKASKRVILRGEAMDHQALMTFLEKLESQPVLKNVHLTHQENVARERLVTITFEIKATLGR